jgi:hypothetical protein
MLSKQLLESLQTAAKENANVKVINNTASNGDDYTIKPFETLVIVDNDASYTQNLFLPAVAESKGVTITIYVPDVGGGGTIADNDDSRSDWADLTMNADGEYAILYNTGAGWIKLASDM